MKCFPNIDGVNFDNVEHLAPAHEAALPVNREVCTYFAHSLPIFMIHVVLQQGEVSTTVPAAPFTNVTRITLFFAANHSLGEDDETIIQYIGM
jgi:hypothetical protein